MTYDWTVYFCLFLGLWSAVVGGVFSAFSEFIMSALRQAEAESGINAMQEINKTVIKTQFVAGIILISVFSAVFGIYAAMQFSGSARIALILAPIVYISSVFLMTIAGNVPMNDKLERFDRRSAEAIAYWPTYVRVWTRLNHVRTIGSVATAAIYLIGTLLLISSGQA